MSLNHSVTYKGLKILYDRSEGLDTIMHAIDIIQSEIEHFHILDSLTLLYKDTLGDSDCCGIYRHKRRELEIEVTSDAMRLGFTVIHELIHAIHCHQWVGMNKYVELGKQKIPDKFQAKARKLLRPYASNNCCEFVADYCTELLLGTCSRDPELDELLIQLGGGSILVGSLRNSLLSSSIDNQKLKLENAEFKKKYRNLQTLCYTFGFLALAFGSVVLGYIIFYIGVFGLGILIGFLALVTFIAVGLS